MSDPVQCPICSKLFALDRIEGHVDQCLNEGTKETATPILSEQGILDTTPMRKRPSMVGLEDRVKDTKHLKLTPSYSNLKQSHLLVSDSSSSSSTSSKVITSSLMSYDITKPSVPLADVMRPKLIEDYIGQEKVIGKESILRKIFETGNVPSLIFWGPPGCGKVSYIMFSLIPRPQYFSL